MDLCFSVKNLEKVSSNPGKVKSYGLVKLLGYIRYNKNLGLKYYSKIDDAPLSDILIQVSIKPENQGMLFSDSSWKQCLDTCRNPGAYIVFYQGVSIDHCTHVPGPVAQSSADSEYNSTCTEVISLAHFRMLNNELLNMYP